MSRKLFALLSLSVFVVSLVAVALAAESPGGNFRKGKYLFRKNCRSCHAEGAAAKDLSPADKTQAEWTALFKDASAIPCHADWKGLSESDQLDIFTYMHDFAKDSPSPAKCS
ncbi:c-type cytochrome [Desulfovibrio inopinatus]|uniref:c-type cytochrome n=1 Tax=Desulfovibrio inopinatus TaxID=102109 RepID=UPI000424DCE3|nr:cytochrome c [Desulfovibrio inopinatus]